MLLNEIIKNLLNQIETATNINKKDLQSCLEVSCSDSKPHCTFFFIKIRSNAPIIAKEVYETLNYNQITGLKNITIRNSSVSFDIDILVYVKKIINNILENKENYGSNNLGDGKKVVLDYSSPNIAKIFHIGHLRTTILGNFIKNLYNFCGYKAVGINYLGDWGKQFGLVLLGYEKYGSEEELKKDPHKHLFDVYVKINQEAEKNENIHVEAKKIFEQMENENNQKYLDLWKRFRDISIKKYKELYKKIGVEFDEYSGESLYEQQSKKLVKELDFAIKSDDGSILLDVDKETKPLVLKSDGTTLYMTRDICAALDRIDRFNPCKIIYVVASEQTLHFEQLFKIIKKIKGDSVGLEHVKYGLVSGMSTRKGTVKFLEDIINMATEVMLKEIKSNPEKAAKIDNIEDTALILAVSTLVVMDFSAKRIKGYEFDVEKRAKNVSGTGSYLQYAHCRLRSIEEKNLNIDTNEFEEIEDCFFDDELINKLFYKLLWFEKIVCMCLEDHEPSRIVTYLNDLCGFVNSINNKLKVKGEEINIARARLIAFKCSRIVIGNALRLFGLTPLNRM